MKIIIATHNPGKRAELQRILAPLGVDVLLPSEAGIELTDVEETGSTFAENARLKALSGMRESGLPCVADDSGLCVDALGGRPGIYTARYGGEEMSYPDKMKKLLGELEGLEGDARNAHFISSICCVFPDGEEITAEGRCDGRIGTEISGSGGFGFDPVFCVGGRSFASLTAQEKDAVSHRGNALRLFAEKLEEARGGSDERQEGEI